ncbi:LysR family transcriptional regulator [Actinoplanes sp. NBRC 101535]|uniref:LysR family transcriptional regulator n=1 Tax=Actinoplanes sp. NBRC 101535 TaxID=3032196 RepID=UPI0024A556F8|nr:LysR family transcriptional regulator [Actinoplanes sp. NBRC 101535]GLY08162.1 LysR family transcriptional regulator [Actinoplanes sp. NBRC 101535]
MHLDLNLLTALDALLEEGSVAGAAARLRLSAPAVSRTLGRIRRLTGDDILVRAGRTMIPTPYALSVQAQVSDLVRQANQVLTPSRDLDLGTLDRTFTLRCHDALATALAPDLLRVVARDAPGVRIRLLAETPDDTDDLRHGRVDLEIGAGPPEPPEFRSATVGHDGFVVVMRSGHPHAGDLTLAGYADGTHVLVSRRGRLADPVDDILAGHGLHRRVLAAVGSAATAAHVVSRGDSLLTLPSTVCRPLIDAFGLVTAAPPVTLPPVPIVCAWHQRYDSDAAHTWLRGLVRSVFAGLAAPTPRPGSTAGTGSPPEQLSRPEQPSPPEPPS